MTHRTPAQMHDADAVRAFILGGNAKFTLVSLKTGTRYTFKVSVAKDDDDLYFVSTLIGSDNEADYAYLGIIPEDLTFRITKKSRFNTTSPQYMAFSYLWNGKLRFAVLPGEQLPPQLEFWHEGTCCRCGRTLTVPASIAAGIGPECATRV